MHYQEGGAIGLSEEDMAPARAAFAKYADDLDAAGVLIGTQVLQSAVSSTTFTARDGAPRIQDGPFADTKERLGGVFVIEVPDLDAARFSPLEGKIPRGKTCRFLSRTAGPS